MYEMSMRKVSDSSASFICCFMKITAKYTFSETRLQKVLLCRLYTRLIDKPIQLLTIEISCYSLVLTREK